MEVVVRVAEAAVRLQAAEAFSAMDMMAAARSQKVPGQSTRNSKYSNRYVICSQHGGQKQLCNSTSTAPVDGPFMA
ncbi:hypothetical protein P7K49_010197 [Saguinus oedipus]|uniref:Uncharacterized protein n=1 Tax=Saguinus oedipus TaxID=9490 RepID=A0ABQ9VMU6_SAGOE|nr:hypothetical protein P7K49_010197 [Saguinus oedipus]